MNLERAYDRVDMEAPWNVLKIYCVDGQLLEGYTTFHSEASTCG